MMNADHPDLMRYLDGYKMHEAQNRVLMEERTMATMRVGATHKLRGYRYADVTDRPHVFGPGALRVRLNEKEVTKDFKVIAEVLSDDNCVMTKEQYKGLNTQLLAISDLAEKAYQRQMEEDEKIPF